MSSRRSIILILIIGLLTSILILHFYFWRAPAGFPTNIIYTVESGVGLSVLSQSLQEKKIIRSPFWFKSFSVLFGGTKGVVAGDYKLPNRANAITLAKVFSTGKYGLTPVKLIIPEGLNSAEITILVQTHFANIKSEDFRLLAKAQEGYLFPDTYFFSPNVTTEMIINTMRKNFENKILTIQAELSATDKNLDSIVKMASVLEAEARTQETRRMIADILWRRIELGIPLQVDASFKYINGKNSSNLTLEDLKIDSPYNSYKYQGLPPTPINNPGLEAILDAMMPMKNEYLYFLTDKDGNMHYAKTHQEHVQNKAKYLK